MSVCEIVSNLWLGNILVAKNKMFFDENNIDYVINCTKDVPFYSNYTQNVRISVDDNLKSNEINTMYKYLNRAADFIHNKLQDNKTILVHCYAGKQRSASIICGYLMKYCNMKCKDAITAIKSKRLIAFTPAINFQQALYKFEKDLI